jgi:hypothetical protein
LAYFPRFNRIKASKPLSATVRELRHGVADFEIDAVEELPLCRILAALE